MYSSFSARALGLSLSAVETIELAATAGFGGVDFLLRDLRAEGADPKALRTRLDDRGLQAGAWALPVDWRGDADRFHADLAELPRFAEAAAILGATRTGTWVMPETPEPAGPGQDAASVYGATMEWHCQRLGAIARILDDHGIQLGLEVIGVESSRPGRGLPFVTRLGDLNGVLRLLWPKAANVGILVDGFHLYAAGEAMEMGLHWGVDRVVWAHVADLPAASPPDRRSIQDHDRGLPGENGAVESGRLLQLLSQAGYSGPVTAEPLARCRSLAGRSAQDVARLVASAMKSIWPRPTP